MKLESERAALAYASFDLWMSRQLEELVLRWISLAAPRDARNSTGRRCLGHMQEDRSPQPRD
jgi:hypothetical protein